MKLLTASRYFEVKKTKMFKITEQTVLVPNRDVSIHFPFFTPFEILSFVGRDRILL
jgi:hypothetical protein